ncbi:MAG: GNAT family N-acetyltransferase [Mycoplasmatales bacterium]
MPVSIKKIINKEELKPILQLRYNIFCIEQLVPNEEEFDKYDEIFDDSVVLHFGYYVNSNLVGCSRVIQTPEFYKIGRVAIDANNRSQGHGFKMIEMIIEQLPKDKYYYLSAQLSAMPLYEKLGFKSYGEIYLDANIKHMDMRRDKDE